MAAADNRSGLQLAVPSNRVGGQMLVALIEGFAAMDVLVFLAALVTVKN